MNRRRGGFALAAVLAALMLTMMVVAVSAQRALLEVRQASLAQQRVELDAALAAAQRAALASTPDSAALVGAPPGATLAEGVEWAGNSSAAWTIRGGPPAFAVAEVAARVVTPPGIATARAVARRVLAAKIDSLGVLHWSPVGTAGWVRMPSP